MCAGNNNLACTADQCDANQHVSLLLGDRSLPAIRPNLLRPESTEVPKQRLRTDMVSAAMRPSFKGACRSGTRLSRTPHPCNVTSGRLVAAASAHGRQQQQAQPASNWQGQLAACSLAAALVLGAAAPPPALAARSKVGEFQASGFLFKDSVEVTALDDPEVPGVTLYISDFKRSLVDKLQKDFFAEPSQASLSCSADDGVVVPEARLGGTEGKEVFAEKKGLSIFKDKTLRVRRVWDPERRTLVYVAYSTRLSSTADEGGVSTGRYRTSLCALHIPSPTEAPALQEAEAVAATL